MSHSQALLKLFSRASRLLRCTARYFSTSAVKFLVKTGLDRSILRQIWELSDTQKQHALGPNEFQVTLRYVCLSQNGHVLSDNVLQETKELVLPDPKFEGIDMPSLVDKTEETNKDMGTNNTDNGGITGMDAFASLVPSMPEPVMDMNVAMPDPNLVSSVNMVDEKIYSLIVF